jgi:hypothetical protein
MQDPAVIRLFAEGGLEEWVHVVCWVLGVEVYEDLFYIGPDDMTDWYLDVVPAETKGRLRNLIAVFKKEAAALEMVAKP